MLADATRAQAMIVTLAEETPVNEAIELAFDLEESLGLALAPLVVNGCWPERPGLAIATTTAARQAGVTITAAQRSALVASSRFGAARLLVQAEQMARLDDRLPLARLELPRLPTTRLESDDLDQLADALSRHRWPTDETPFVNLLVEVFGCDLLLSGGVRSRRRWLCVAGRRLGGRRGAEYVVGSRSGGCGTARRWR